MKGNHIYVTISLLYCLLKNLQIKHLNYVLKCPFNTNLVWVSYQSTLHNTVPDVWLLLPQVEGKKHSIHILLKNTLLIHILYKYTCKSINICKALLCWPLALLTLQITSTVFAWIFRPQCAQIDFRNNCLFFSEIKLLNKKVC